MHKTSSTGLGREQARNGLVSNEAKQGMKPNKQGPKRQGAGSEGSSKPAAWHLAPLADKWAGKTDTWKKP